MRHLVEEYHKHLEDLEKVVKNVNNKVLSNSSDPFFINNLNFLTKSFLVTICAYLESFIKDITYSTIEDYNDWLKGLGIPINLTKWSFNPKKQIDDEHLKFAELTLNIKKKDLDDYVSSNPFKTIKLFKQIGIDLEKNEIFNDLKKIINSIVTKRNNVIHYNDDASDITLSDILDYIGVVQKYIELIDLEIQKTLKDYSYQCQPV